MDAPSQSQMVFSEVLPLGRSDHKRASIEDRLKAGTVETFQWSHHERSSIDQLSGNNTGDANRGKSASTAAAAVEDESSSSGEDDGVLEEEENGEGAAVSASASGNPGPPPIALALVSSLFTSEILPPHMQHGGQKQLGQIPLTKECFEGSGGGGGQGMVVPWETRLRPLPISAPQQWDLMPSGAGTGSQMQPPHDGLRTLKEDDNEGSETSSLRGGGGPMAAVTKIPATKGGVPEKRIAAGGGGDHEVGKMSKMMKAVRRSVEIVKNIGSPRQTPTSSPPRGAVHSAFPSTAPTSGAADGGWKVTINKT